MPPARTWSISSFLEILGILRSGGKSRIQRFWGCHGAFSFLLHRVKGELHPLQIRLSRYCQLTRAQNNLHRLCYSAQSAKGSRPLREPSQHSSPLPRFSRDVFLAHYNGREPSQQRFQFATFLRNSISTRDLAHRRIYGRKPCVVRISTRPKPAAVPASTTAARRKTGRHHGKASTFLKIATTRSLRPPATIHRVAKSYSWPSILIAGSDLIRKSVCSVYGGRSALPV